MFFHVHLSSNPFTFHSKQIGFNQTWCTKKTGDLAGRPKQTSEVCHPKEPTCWWEDFRASKPPWCPKVLLVAHRWGAHGQCGGESVKLLFKTWITSKETNGNLGNGFDMISKLENIRSYQTQIHKFAGFKCGYVTNLPKVDMECWIDCDNHQHFRCPTHFRSSPLSSRQQQTQWT